MKELEASARRSANTVSAAPLARLALPLSLTVAAVATSGCGANTTPEIAALASTALVQVSTPSVTFSVNTTPVGPWPKSVAVGHVDGDGFLDVVVGHRDTTDVHVLYGNGQGSYLPRTGQPPIRIDGFPYYVALTDLDGDELPDLVASDMTAKLLKIFRNAGGTFDAASTAVLKVDVENSVTNRGSESPMALAIADFNRDGRNDIVAFQREDDTAFVFQNDGGTGISLSEVQRIALPHLSTPWAALAVDVDAAGGLDVAFTQVEDGRGNVNGSVGFLLNQAAEGGPAEFVLASREIPVGRWPYDIDAGDVDGNGRPDLVVANGFSKSATLLVRDPGAANEPVYNPITLTAGNNPKDAQIADFDEDGDDDVVIANHLSSSFTFYFNCGGGTGSFGAGETLSGLADLGRPIGMKKARDAGGRWDLVFGSAQTAKFFSLKNLGATPPSCTSAAKARAR